MSDIDIRKIVEDSFSSMASRKYHEDLKNELYPGSLTNESGYLRVKAALDINNKHMKECLIKALSEVVNRLK